MKKYFLVLCLLIITSFAGCSKEVDSVVDSKEQDVNPSQSVNEPVTNTVEVEPISLNDFDVKYRNIVLGPNTSLQEIESALNISLAEGDNIERKNEFIGDNASYSWCILHYPSIEEEEIEIQYIYNEKDGSGKIASIDLKQYANKRDIKVGDTIEKIEKVYGDLGEVFNYIEDTSSYQANYENAVLHIAIDSKSKKVIAIQIVYDINPFIEEIEQLEADSESEENLIYFSEGAFNDRDITQLFKLSRAEVEQYLGTDYRITEGDVAGTKRYAYENHDIEIEYEYGEGRIMLIDCGPEVFVYSANEGMDFEEIKTYFWEQEIITNSKVEDSDTVYYELSYRIGNMDIVFTSLHEDGSDSKLSIINLAVQGSEVEQGSIRFSEGPFNEQDITQLFKLSRAEVERYLGTDYRITGGGVEGAAMFVYDNHDIGIEYESDSRIWYIDCGSEVSINQAKAGMNFGEIKTYLGELEINSWSREEDPDTIFYQLVYTIDNMRIKFTSFNEDGTDSWLSIFNL